MSSLFHLSVVDEELQQDLHALGAHDVSEIFSPPRFTDKCRSFGLLPGYAIDLETGWNLLEKTQRLSLLRSLEEEDPYVVTGSPPCGPFSALQGLNEGRVDPVKRQQRLDEGKKLLKIACEFYEKQIERGRYFLHEHPSSARSWQEDCIKKIAEKPNVYVVEGPMCRWKMMGRDASGTSYVKKPTKWMTNSKVLAELEWSMQQSRTRRTLASPRPPREWKSYNGTSVSTRARESSIERYQGTDERRWRVS